MTFELPQPHDSYRGNLGWYTTNDGGLEPLLEGKLTNYFGSNRLTHLGSLIMILMRRPNLSIAEQILTEAKLLQDKGCHEFDDLSNLLLGKNKGSNENPSVTLIKHLKKIIAKAMYYQLKGVDFDTWLIQFNAIYGDTKLGGTIDGKKDLKLPQDYINDPTDANYFNAVDGDANDFLLEAYKELVDWMDDGGLDALNKAKSAWIHKLLEGTTSLAVAWMFLSGLSDFDGNAKLGAYSQINDYDQKLTNLIKDLQDDYNTLYNGKKYDSTLADDEKKALEDAAKKFAKDYDSLKKLISRNPCFSGIKDSLLSSLNSIGQTATTKPSASTIEAFVNAINKGSPSAADISNLIIGIQGLKPDKADATDTQNQAITNSFKSLLTTSTNQSQSTNANIQQITSDLQKILNACNAGWQALAQVIVNALGHYTK